MICAWLHFFLLVKIEPGNSKLENRNSKFGVRFTICNYPISNLKFQISNLKFPISISDFKFQISNFQFLISDFKSQISNLKFPVSNFRFQISNWGVHLTPVVKKTKENVPENYDLRLKAKTGELCLKRSFAMSLSLFSFKKVRLLLESIHSRRLYSEL
jgi:hypothetical protein